MKGEKETSSSSGASSSNYRKAGNGFDRNVAIIVLAVLIVGGISLIAYLFTQSRLGQDALESGAQEQQVQTGQSTGLGGKPAFPRPGEPRSESIFTHELLPGEEQEEGVLVVNNSSESKDVLVYATDSEVSSGGAFTCAQFGDDKNDVGAWIELAKNEVNLSSRADELVSFTIAVPEGARPGEHNGCIVIEENEPTFSDEPGINLQTRTAIRVRITVPGDLIRQVSIDDFSVSTTESREKLLTMMIGNQGNVSEDVFTHIVSRGLFDRPLNVNGGRFVSLAEEPLTLNFPVADLFWGGIVKASSLLEIDGRDYSGFAVKLSTEEQSRLTGSDFDTSIVDEQRPWPEGSEMFIVGPTLTVWVWPSLTGWVVYGASLAVLLALIIWWIVAAGRRRSVKKSWKPHKIKKGDTLVILAQERGISWKRVAKINNLRAPYELKTGQRLLLPAKKK